MSDDALIRKAKMLTGEQDKVTVLRQALIALIERESARSLARLGGSEPNLAVPRRRRVRRARGA